MRVSFLPLGEGPGVRASLSHRQKATASYQDTVKMGDLAAEYLISRIENPEAPVHQRILVPELVIRESTCPPAV